jgi:hypothetical protein
MFLANFSHLRLWRVNLLNIVSLGWSELSIVGNNKLFQDFFQIGVP